MHVFIVECNLPIKTKGHSSPDICWYNIFSPFSCERLALAICPGITYTVYIGVLGFRESKSLMLVSWNSTIQHDGALRLWNVRKGLLIGIASSQENRIIIHTAAKTSKLARKLVPSETKHLHVINV